MRPAGEVRLALLSAACELAVPGVRGPTLQEMAHRACVGYDAAMHTVKNLTRAGQLTIARQRKVDYRNKPVAEYEPKTAEAEDSSPGFVDLGSLMTVWNR